MAQLLLDKNNTKDRLTYFDVLPCINLIYFYKEYYYYVKL